MKLKVHKGAKKRFKVTGSGNIKRGQAGKRHLLTSKTRKRKRNLRGLVAVNASNVKAIKNLLQA